MNILETDVLIFGGGGAGCRAAIEAHDNGVEVIIAVKGKLGHTGCTLNVGTSAGVGRWAVKEDTPTSAMKDLLAHGGYLGNQEMVKVLVDETPNRISELESWGVDFERDENGDIEVTHAAKHEYPRNVRFKPTYSSHHDYGYPPGIAMMDALMSQIQERNIQVMNDVMLVDLIKINGEIVGAITLDCNNFEMIIIKAKSTIIATGSFSQIFELTTVSTEETGDGHAAAFRAGAELIDMENTQFVATSTGYRPTSIFLNSKGETFLENYGIKGLSDVDKETLCYAIAKEIKEGRGTESNNILIDMTGDWEKENLPSSIEERIEKNLKERGSPYLSMTASKAFNPRTTVVESGPISHTTTGGIRTNEKCETSIPGLYVAGAAAGGVYGHARPEGYTSMITLVFGQRAGFFASKYSKVNDHINICHRSLHDSLGNAMELIEKSGGIKPSDTKTEIKKIMQHHGWVIKDEITLNEGLRKIREIKEIQYYLRSHSTSKNNPVNGTEGIIAIEIPNMMLCAELMLVGAIKRKESRGAFFRDDYPKTDNKKWLKNIIYKQINGEIDLSLSSIDLTYCKP